VREGERVLAVLSTSNQGQDHEHTTGWTVHALQYWLEVPDGIDKRECNQVHPAAAAVHVQPVQQVSMRLCLEIRHTLHPCTTTGVLACSPLYLFMFNVCTHPHQYLSLSALVHVPDCCLIPFTLQSMSVLLSAHPFHPCCPTG
jgi:hypothetical protein